ncbi:MAG TPA: threonine synthase [Acidobacteriota bacterium]|nr:threonine synthase [Acidobacteriota bacterium]
MKNILGFQCVECCREHLPDAVSYACPCCGGNLDVIYDYSRVRKELNRDSLAANQDLTIWRYKPLLPIGNDSPLPALPVGWTPTFDCPRLAKAFAVNRLMIKDDGRNPTASFKDRPSALAAVMARDAGAEIITTASSGNAGVALAGTCASLGAKSVIFVPASAPPAKLAQLQIYGATVILVEGSYDEAYDLCLEAARRYGWYQRSTGYNPYMTEGKKTAALEIAEQLNWDLPDKVFVSMGDGCIIGALWKGFSDLLRLGMVERRPQLIGVQAQGAAAIVDAVSGDGIARAGPAQTIADSICVGKPRDATKAVRAIRESGGSGIKVSDAEIVTAIGRLARDAGVFVEPAAAAAFAGFVRMSKDGRVSSRERVLLMLTGSGLKDITAARALLQEPLRVRPDVSELSKLANIGSVRD